jgi:hypothetical protein
MDPGGRRRRWRRWHPLTEHSPPIGSPGMHSPGDNLHVPTLLTPLAVRTPSSLAPSPKPPRPIASSPLQPPPPSASRRPRPLPTSPRPSPRRRRRLRVAHGVGLRAQHGASSCGEQGTFPARPPAPSPHPSPHPVYPPPNPNPRLHPHAHPRIAEPCLALLAGGALQHACLSFSLRSTRTCLPARPRCPSRKLCSDDDTEVEESPPLCSDANPLCVRGIH